MKILITGADGQLAGQLKHILSLGKSELDSIDEIYLTAQVKYVNRQQLDISRLSDVLNIVDDFRPDIIVNCAAYTNVDKCETDFENAFKVNSLGPRNLAIASKVSSAKLVHISTDYVFNGKGDVPFKEYDLPDPASVYGKTKLLGEQYVRENCSQYFIIRTSWLYGLYGRNFVYTILKAAKEKGHLDVVDDQMGNPTNAEDLAYHILKLMLGEEYGIYHCTGNGECSWYDFARKIVEYADIECTVDSMKSDKLKRAAQRPEFSSLDNMMLRCTVGDNMRQWQDALKSFISNCRL